MKTTALRLTAFYLLLLAGDVFAATKPGMQQPDFIFLLADDLGANEVGCAGNKDEITTNIDRLELARGTSARRR